jgi:hypothetical protein
VHLHEQCIEAPAPIEIPSEIPCEIATARTRTLSPSSCTGHGTKTQPALILSFTNLSRRQKTFRRRQKKKKKKYNDRMRTYLDVYLFHDLRFLDVHTAIAFASEELPMREFRFRASMKTIRMSTRTWSKPCRTCALARALLRAKKRVVGIRHRRNAKRDSHNRNRNPRRTMQRTRDVLLRL